MWRFSLQATMVVVVALLAEPTQATTEDRGSEGDWYVSDSTDNNTGEREVYALQMHLKGSDSDRVNLTLRCTNKRPTFFIGWTDLSVADQTVVTISPAVDHSKNPDEERYVFEMSEELIDRGLRASPEISAKIIAAIGNAKLVVITVHLPTKPRTVAIDVDGTQRAWNRVSRHCPAPLMPLPPL